MKNLDLGGYDRIHFSLQKTVYSVRSWEEHEQSHIKEKTRNYLKRQVAQHKLKFPSLKIKQISKDKVHMCILMILIFANMSKK